MNHGFPVMFMTIVSQQLTIIVMVVVIQLRCQQMFLSQSLTTIDHTLITNQIITHH